MSAFQLDGYYRQRKPAGGVVSLEIWSRPAMRYVGSSVHKFTAGDVKKDIQLGGCIEALLAS